MAVAARRRYPAYALSRVVWLAPALGLPWWGWDQLGQPVSLPGPEAAWGHAAGLAVMILASLCVIPGLFVTLACFAPDLPKMCVPRKWRAAYRNREDRHGYKRHSRASQKSSYISERLRYLVNRADRFRCTGCGARGASDVDHRIPWGWGGLTILWNCFTLCANCNRVIKVDYWEDFAGRAHWGRHFNTTYRLRAHEIFRRESRRRWNPVRMFRIAWAVGS
jgi:5-methylcytosine-specific restriction endonuclease McrA